MSRIDGDAVSRPITDLDLAKQLRAKKIEACQRRQVAALFLPAFQWERVFGKHRSDDAL